MLGKILHTIDQNKGKLIFIIEIENIQTSCFLLFYRFFYALHAYRFVTLLGSFIYALCSFFIIFWFFVFLYAFVKFDLLFYDLQCSVGAPFTPFFICLFLFIFISNFSLFSFTINPIIFHFSFQFLQLIRFTHFMFYNFFFNFENGNGHQPIDKKLYC